MMVWMGVCDGSGECATGVGVGREWECATGVGVLDGACQRRRACGLYLRVTCQRLCAVDGETFERIE